MRTFFNWGGWIGFFFFVLMIALSTGGGVNTSLVYMSDFDASVEVRDEAIPWQIYPDIQQTGSASYYRIIANRYASLEDQQWGHVVLVHYASPEETGRAYEAIRREAEVDRQPYPINFGERGSQSAPTTSFKGSDVLFVRCGTIVHLALEGDGMQWMLEYARRLDQRIMERICKE